MGGYGYFTPELGGWTTQTLIELADRRTERRGSKTLDLNSEFLMALQYLCMEARWSWRRKVGFFQMTPGKWTYDLTNPIIAGGPAANDLQQFVKHGVKIYPNPGNYTTWGELTPMFERDLQTNAIYQNMFNPLVRMPQQYFMYPGAFLLLAVAPVPDQAYPVTIDYWSYPNLSLDSIPDQIPLIPAFMHNVLLKRLEAQIFRYTLGEGAAKYQAAMGEYNMLVAKYLGMDGMVPGEHLDYSADDDYESVFGNNQNAIQSTHG
jgi:hypothetical protein